MVVTASGEFLVASAQNLPDGSSNRVAVIRRYDPAAGELGTTEFPTPDGDADDIAHAIALGTDGSVVVFGQTAQGLADTDLWIARLSADLTLQDIGVIDGGDDDIPGGVVALGDGSIVFAADGTQEYVARVTADLSPVWTVPDGTSGPVVLGDQAIFTVVGNGRAIEKLDLDGQPQWADDPCLDGEPAEALAISPDGTQLIVGRYRIEDAGYVVELYDAAS